MWQHPGKNCKPKGRWNVYLEKIRAQESDFSRLCAGELWNCFCNQSGRGSKGVWHQQRYIAKPPDTAKEQPIH